MEMIDSVREGRILSILIDDPQMILMFKEEFITENMWRVAISNEPPIFQYVHNPSNELVLFALSQDGTNIRYLQRMGIDYTPEIIYTAINQYPGAIFMLPEHYQTNRVKEYACARDPSLMKHLVLRESYVNKRLRADPTEVRYLQAPSEEQLLKALDENPTVCAYIHQFTPNMIRLIKRKYPSLIQMIPHLKSQISELNED